MKKIFIAIGIVISLLLSVLSCGKKESAENTGQEQERDSLNRVIVQQKTVLDDMTSAMAEITSCLDTIASHERVIVSGVDENGRRLGRKGIRARLEILAKVIREQKEKLGALEQKFSNNAVQIGQLHSIITFLENSLAQKDREVEKLRAEVDSKNFSVAVLEEQVSLMSDTLTVERATNTEQKQQIAKQDAQLNEVYYVIGTDEELISKGVMKKEGKLIKRKKVNFTNVNRSALSKGDIRTLRTINIAGKSPKILGDVPKGSYTLEKNSNESYTLRITNPDLFWSSNNRILIIQIKK